MGADMILTIKTRARMCCWLLCIASFAIACCGAGAGSASARAISQPCQGANGSSVSPESESAAQRDAAALLAELPLPAGSSESATEPAEEDSLLTGPAYRPLTPNLVDEHAWWLVPLAPAEALAYVCEHLPPGAETQSTGGRSGPNVPENEFAAFAVPGSPGSLVINVVRLPNGSTALRADAQVVWITPRPATEAIASGARLMRIAVHAPSSRRDFEPEWLPLLLRLPWQVASVAQIDRIVSLLNELEVAQPGLRHCPFEGTADSNVELSFYASADVAPLAVADIHLEGCGGVSLTLGGVPQPSLEGGSELIGPIGEILGVQSSIGPPVGPTPHLSSLRMSRKRFAVNAEDTVTPGVEPGSEFQFELSAPAEVSVAISRLPRGSDYADTCGANAERPRRLRSEDCRRTVVLDRFTRTTEPEGRDAIAFSGWVGRRALALGRYVAVLRARNSGGSSRLASVEFEITR